MLKQIFKNSLIAVVTSLLIAGCGGSDSPRNSGTGNEPGSGSGPGTGNPGTGVTIEGEAGDFGDSATAANSTPGVYTVCPADVESFSSFGQNGSNWCVPKCPTGASGFENSDGDDWGSYLSGQGDSRYTCFITPNSPGDQVQIYFSAPIDGCPAPVGCPSGSFPAVFVSESASNDQLAGNYQCADWDFDVDTQAWTQQTSPAPLSLTLGVDGSATVGGVTTSWSFTNGVLSLEGNRIFNNVAVGSGSFTEYFSNTYITRCKGA